MLRVLTAALLGGFFVCASAFPANAAQPPVCTQHAALVEQLAKKYGETVTASGFDGAGNYIEVFSSEKGTWTIAISIPGGPTCVIAAGDNWEQDAGSKRGQES